MLGSFLLMATGCQMLRSTQRVDVGSPANPAVPPENDPPQGPQQPTGHGLSVVQGNGQVTPARFAFPDALQVKLTDSAGHPVAGATVTWKSSDTQGALNFTQTTSLSDANGVASLSVTAGSIGTTESSRIVIVTASATIDGQAASVPLYETVAMAGSGGVSLPRAFFLESQATYTVPANGVLKGAIKIAVINSAGDQQGGPVPGVALTVTPIYPQGSDPSTLPHVSCQGDLVLTDLQGEATCDQVAGSQTGTVQVSVSVGRFVTYDKSSVQVQ
jgi:hypothetical protein